MKKTTLSICLISTFLLSACNSAYLGIINKSHTDSEIVAKHDTSDVIVIGQPSIPDLLPDWTHYIPESSSYEVEHYAEQDPFEINTADIQTVGYDIIWDHIRAGYRLPTSDHKKVKSEVRWFSSHKAYINRVVDRAEPFLHFILDEIKKRDMPTELALLPIVESAFQPFAYSHGQAAGIWQFIPSTGRHYGLKQNWWYDGRRDVFASTKAALDYLQYLAKVFDGDWLHALAAYNSGVGTVSRAIRKNKRRSKPIDFWHLKLPKETQGYVPKLMALSKIIKNPEDFDIDLKCIQDAPYFEVVPIDSQIDLALAAELADIDIEELYRLNPGNNRWATDPKGPHRLLLPVENAEQFKAGLLNIPAKDRVSWKRYKVKPEETLSHIATKHHVTVDELKRINNLRSNIIRAGKHLIIPVASKRQSHYALSKQQREQTRRAIKRPGNKVVHIVKSGESFWNISRQYNVGTQQLARWNGLSPKDVLRAGQKLVVWTKKKILTTKVNSSIVGDFIRSIRYRVRNGDSLSRIAQRFNVSVSDLKRWNILKGKYLKPGQTLKLYVDITNQASSS